MDLRSERMRGFENAWRQVIPPRQYVILRVDGRAFHTLTRHMDKPFDYSFMHAMRRSAEALCAEVQGCQFAYQQSDEISLLITDFGSMQQQWFGGVVQKMCSVAASVASVAFDRADAHFDARVFTIPTRDEVINYFMWRQADCRRNAVSMIAEAHFPSKQLHGKSVTERIMMLNDQGISLSDYPMDARLGCVTFKVTREETVTYIRKDTGEEHTEVATRSHWVTQAAPQFTHAQMGSSALNSYVPSRGGVVEGSGVTIEPKRISQMISFRIDPDIAAELRDIANRRRVTVTDLLRHGAFLVCKEGESDAPAA